MSKEAASIGASRATEKRKELGKRAALSAIQKASPGRCRTRDPKVEALLHRGPSDPTRRREGHRLQPSTLDKRSTSNEEACSSTNESLRDRGWVVLRGGKDGRSVRRRFKKMFESTRTSCLLLAQTDAASEGINRADGLAGGFIHLELPWNPKNNPNWNSGMDASDRYGQTRNPEIRYLFYPDKPRCEDVLQPSRREDRANAG
jgi:hypothetical protein